MVKKAHKTVGVMGGMGPDATVDFMAKVVALTDAACDQDHVHMLVDQDPTVPNRQLAIASGNDDVTSRLGIMARRLEAAGAEFLVMVCNTAHVFLDDVRSTTTIPFVDLIEESVAEIERLCPEARSVGVMATNACLESGIYQDVIEKSGRQPVITNTRQTRELMNLINAVKAGDQGAAVRQGVRSIASGLVEDGAEVLIAGCTEIPLVFGDADSPVPVIESTNVLARRTVALATGLASFT
ncbi:MAG: aspartate/glutamate racemase family protein [Woeseiaceae bacterium]